MLSLVDTVRASMDKLMKWALSTLRAVSRVEGAFHAPDLVRKTQPTLLLLSVSFIPTKLTNAPPPKDAKSAHGHE